MLPFIDMKATGKRIDDLRIERGLAKMDVQHHLGFNTPQAIYKWINGHGLPSIDNLVILADLFECRIDDILVVVREAEHD